GSKHTMSYLTFQVDFRIWKTYCFVLAETREDPVNNDVEFYKPLHVPDNSFPSLQYLCLQGLFDETMARLFKVPVLFRHLIKTTIVFLDGPFFANVIECLD
ncbi:hypothetical protein FRC12_023739, partial [Ceratobasidium sp. 428]